MHRFSYEKQAAMHHTARPTIRLVSRACLALTLVASASCSDIVTLKQSSSGQIDASDFYTPANAQMLVNGVIADFECAYVRYAAGSALASDELANSSATAVGFDYDARRFTPDSPYAGGCASTAASPGFYTGLSTARADADTVLSHFEGWSDAQVPNRAKLMGQLAAYGGYSLILLGEAMCTAAINLSPEMTPAQLFAEAKLRFDRAITFATAANDAATLNFARLGRARTLLDLGDVSGAAVGVELIPADFVVSVSTDAVNARRQNLIFVQTVQSFAATVDTSFRNLTLGGAPDPRVRVTNTGKTGANTLPVWTPDKYAAITTPIPVAKYAEAQLILAEARIVAGDLAGAAAAINAARNSGGRTGLPAYSAAGESAAQVMAQLIEERRREFFLEAHRFQDIRRFNLPLRPAPGAPFFNGGVYGNLKCFPLPSVEVDNNPNIKRS